MKEAGIFAVIYAKYSGEEVLPRLCASEQKFFA